MRSCLGILPCSYFNMWPNSHFTHCFMSNLKETLKLIFGNLPLYIYFNFVENSQLKKRNDSFALLHLIVNSDETVTQIHYYLIIRVKACWRKLWTCRDFTALAAESFYDMFLNIHLHRSPVGCVIL